MDDRSRRAVLCAVGAAGAATLAGCSVLGDLGLPGFDWPSTADGTTEPLSGERDGWPQYGRDPGHEGFASTVRLEDPSEDWRVELAGSLAPPAVVGDRIFLHGSVGTQSEGSGGFDDVAVTAVAAADGSRQWRRKLPMSGFSGCPPIVYRGSVYVGHAGESGVYALDARTGSPRWRRETGRSVNEPALGVGERILASTGERLLAFDERGQRRGRYVLGDDRHASSPPAAGGGYAIYATSIVGTVVALDVPAIGRSEWRYEGDYQFDAPTVADGTAFVTARDHLLALDVARGDVAWTRAVTPSSEVATDGGRLYVATESGDLAAFAASDGSERWRTTLASEEESYLRTRPLVTDGSVLVSTQNPRTDERATCYAVDRRTGEVRWTVGLPGNVGFDAVAAGSRVYVPAYWSTREAGGTLLALSD